MKKKFGSRLLSLLLAVTMVAGYLGMLPPTQADAAVVEYATPATEAELDAVAKWFAATNGYQATGTYAKIINGTVYIWGSNIRNATGFTNFTYTDLNGEVIPVTYGSNITVPTPFPAEAFNNEKACYVVSAISCWYVLTEGTGVSGDTGNNVYTFGMQAQNGIYGVRTSDKSNVYLLNTDAIHNAGRTIVKLKTQGCSVFAQDDQGGWWACSTGTPNQIILQNKSGNPEFGVFMPINDEIMTKVGGKIIDIAGQWSYCTQVIGADGKLWGFGNYGSPGASGIGVRAEEAPSGQTNINGIDYGAVWSQLTNVRFKSNTAEDGSSVAISTDGDVWGFGGNSESKFGANYNNTTFDASHKIFDHNIFQKKAVRAWITLGRVVVLCDDNTVYAMGNNSNGVIMPGAGSYVDKMTQILTEVSKTDTIVGVFPSNNSQMAITKAGDMIFAGSNATGGAGNGTTTSAPQGETTPVTSPTMPPSEPLTKNTVSFEIEVVEDNKTVTYRPKTTGDGTIYIRTQGTNVTEQNTMKVDAGTPFKLNVYFEDFGKINTFVLPIRFNPNYLEVVNGNGTPYSNTTPIVTPGSIGASVGIEQCFTVRDWLGGTLAVGTKGNTYPKISNADGWISVAGYSADSNPIIDGKVKMFSIAFRAKTTVENNNIAFAFADADNIVGNPLGAGYDVNCNGISQQKGTAYWSIYNASGNGGESGYFEVKHEPFPKFNSQLVVLSSLGMKLTYGATDTEVAEGSTEITLKHEPAWVINWDNKSVTYTIHSLPYHGQGANKAAGASFPQVSWSFDVPPVDADANNHGRILDDYITIVDQQETYVKFKINPDFHAVADENPGYISVTSTSKAYSGIHYTHYICLKSFEAPDVLELAQKDSSGALVRLADGQEIIYHDMYNNVSSTENRVFWVDFNGATNNTDVVWTLLDKNGDPVDLSSPTAKANLVKSADGSATIEPHNTTAGDDYLVLHVESLFDSSKFDEVKIKIHLYATELGFNPKIIRMAVMKDGVPSSIDLKPYLEVRPVDVYATDYSWAIVDEPTRDPANAKKIDPSFVTGTDVTYGSLGSGSTATVFSAFEWATPKAETVQNEGGVEVTHDEEFVTVRVTDNLSGKTADIKIAIMDLNSPIGIDKFTATNNLGYVNDTVFVSGGLKVGDKVTFYHSYDDAVKKMDPYSTTTLVNGMAPSFQFVVGTREDGLMSGEGGFLAVTITRVPDDGVDEVTFDPVPVSYSAEPSLVDGYVHLFGKNSGSIADKDIRIDLEGLNFKETVYTDASGYFKFTKYIAPGKYSMAVSKKNYLTRRMEPNSEGVGGIEVQVNEDGEFHISTDKNPILLFPGELTNDNAITVQDINYYVANWVGQFDGNITDFDLYDFKEDNTISMTDLELLLMRKDWISGTYPIWNVPQQ